MINIIADENIPFADTLFSELGRVTLKPGRTLSQKDLYKCDALLCRSVTQVNKALLENTSVKFVGTCTIGTDHFDEPYLHDKGITYSSAPGCNAQSVVQYVLCALAKIDRLNRALTMGIVGCGNVGGSLYRTFKNNGFNCKVYDPFLTQQHVDDLSELNDVLSCDVVCLHAPLTYDGEFPSYHLVNERNLKYLKPGGVLLNAGRGEVIDNYALLKYLTETSSIESEYSTDTEKQTLYPKIILDVWENEPNIKTELFPFISIGTPHIAGYSFEGKVNGSTMIFNQLAQFLGHSQSWAESIVEKLKKQHLTRQVLPSANEPTATKVNSLLGHTYNIDADHHNLKSALSGLPESFDQLRKKYPLRREFCAYSLTEDHLNLLNEEEYKFFTSLGFRSRL